MLSQVMPSRSQQQRRIVGEQLAMNPKTSVRQLLKTLQAVGLGMDFEELSALKKEFVPPPEALLKRSDIRLENVRNTLRGKEERLQESERSLGNAVIAGCVLFILLACSIILNAVFIFG